MTAMKFHVSPIWEGLNVADRLIWLMFWCGASEYTCVVMANGVVPLPSVTVSVIAK